MPPCKNNLHKILERCLVKMDTNANQNVYPKVYQLKIDGRIGAVCARKYIFIDC